MKRILTILFVFLSFACSAQFSTGAWAGSLRGCDSYIPVDTDALKYVDSVQLSWYLPNNRKRGIDTLVKDFKDSAMWGSFAYAYYPFPALNANGNRWNLFNPRNTDAAFRLTFVGSPVFDDTGVHFNGTTQYANTYIVPSIVFTLSDCSFGVYSETNILTGTSVMGVFDDPNSLFSINFTAANVVLGNLNAATYTPTNSSGLIEGIRTSSTLLTAYNNITSVATNTTASLTVITKNIFLGARDRGSTGVPDIYSFHTLAFAWITKSKNATNQRKFYNIIQRYERISKRDK